jgi:hypothetical protein
MSDFEKEGWIPYENSGKRGILRLASFALPSLMTISMLLICWRQHFVKQSIEAAVFSIALCVYFAIFLNRRSRGLSAAFFYTSTGPDRDEDSQDQTDVGGLWGAAIIIVGMVYTVIKCW